MPAAGTVPANSINSARVENNSLTGDDIQNGSLGGGDIDDGSLTGADLGLIGTGSVDLGSIPAHSCVQATIDAIPGADGEDLLLVVPTDNGSIQEVNFGTSGELIMVGIPHPGEAHIKVCNVSAGAIDPGSQAYKILLIEA